jgi:hypothetical protein
MSGGATGRVLCPQLPSHERPGSSSVNFCGSSDTRRCQSIRKGAWTLQLTARLVPASNFDALASGKLRSDSFIGSPPDFVAMADPDNSPGSKSRQPYITRIKCQSTIPDYPHAFGSVPIIATGASQPEPAAKAAVLRDCSTLLARRFLKAARMTSARAGKFPQCFICSARTCGRRAPHRRPGRVELPDLRHA